MSKYNTYVLVSTTTFGGGPSRVFFVKKESEISNAVSEEALRSLRLDLHSKYCMDLIPVDLEVVGEAKDLMAQIKKCLPKRKRT